MIKTSLVIPIYNEVDNIKNLFNEIHNFHILHEKRIRLICGNIYFISNLQ